jgi:putative phage-type endonuclease
MLQDDEIECILELIDEYFDETKQLQYMGDYRQTLLIDVCEMIYPDEIMGVKDEEPENWLTELVEEQIDFYFEMNQIPERQMLRDDYVAAGPSTVENLEEIVRKLIETPMVEQRTPEWLEMRHNMLSASNIYRAFKSPATIASLIRDKTTPLAEMQTYNPTGSLNNPMGWGTLFEPVSVSIYEFINRTKVGHFGCIRHPKWSFLGASPDGINVSPSSLFGRMLEIKNIYNREITGIPADEYWVQMQLQMEVCDLPLCDFLETRFCLYSGDAGEFVSGGGGYKEFLLDHDNDFRGAFIVTVDENEKGSRCNKYHHYYLWDYCGIGGNSSVEEFVTVVNNDFKYVKGGVEIYWWYLDEYSCVLVERNRNWFDAIFPQLQMTWDAIMAVRGSTDVLEIVPKHMEICLTRPTKI